MTRSRISTPWWLAIACAVAAACGGTEAPKTTPTEPTTATEPAPSEPAATTEPAAPAEPPAPSEPPAPPAPSYLHGKFVWFELHTADPAKAIAFYNEVLGWKSAETDMGGTKLNFIQNGDKPIGIIMAADKAKKEPTHWVGYVSVADVDAAVERITASGGKIIVPGMDIPEVGRFAAATDPEGAYFSVFKGLKGDMPDGKPATGEWAWHELWSKKPEAAVAFYSTVAEVKSSEMPMGKKKYHMLMTGEIPRAGIDTLPKGQKKALWVPYVMVDNTDDTVKKAKALMAKIILKPTDIPDVGRIAVLVDPTGGTFGVVSAPAAPAEPAPPATK